MADVLTTRQRSFNMSRIRGKDTSPEMTVRKLLSGMGYRYRLHVRRLPGCPDIVLPRLNALIFVHGCFWHMHRCRFGRVTPQTNRAFWQKKRLGNVERDKRNRRRLRKEWSVLTVWECETRDDVRLSEKLQGFLRRQR